MISLYGIKTCDTTRMARRWLEAEGIEYRYCDLRGEGLDVQRLRAWAEMLGWETVLNRRGTTWRALPESSRSTVDFEKAIALMLAHPTLIKRPLLDLGHGRYHAGFTEAGYRSLFG
jgi:Spx/MgsR family transcriptional regulator